MSATIFSSTHARALKKTLDLISQDKTDGSESNLELKNFFKVSTMEDAYEDDLEVAGVGLASEKPEGQEIAAGSIREGYQTRYLARTFGQRLVITEEAIEDNKYSEILELARQLKASMYTTADYDAANVLARGFNSAYVGGDGKPLWATDHPLAQGGSFSNIMATPMSPSVQAVIVATTQIMNYPGHNGLLGRTKIKKIVHPSAQWAVWRIIMGSEKTPEYGNFAEINVVKEQRIETVQSSYWLNTTTNWCVLTDANEVDGLRWKWRRKPRGRSWVTNSNETMEYSNTARWARGWTNPRATLGVGA